MEALTEAQLRVIQRGKYGKYSGLVAKLCHAALEAHRKASRNELAVLMIYSDGYVELYGQSKIRAHVCHVPKVAPHNEPLAAEYAEEQLPAVFHELMMPGNLRAAGNAKSCPPVSSLILAKERQEAIEYLNHLERCRGNTKEVSRSAGH